MLHCHLMKYPPITYGQPNELNQEGNEITTLQQCLGAIYNIALYCNVHANSTAKVV